jgi:hypothetical protein
VKDYQPNPYAHRLLPLVGKVPPYLQYVGFFNLTLGLVLLLALLVSFPGLQHAAALLSQSMETISHLASKLDKLDKLDKLESEAQTKPRKTDFCPFPLDPGCQSNLKAPAALTLPTSSAETDEVTPMGWIYAGKRKTQTALKASNNITQGHVYTLLKSLHVRKLPASRKDPANQRILRVVSAGEKIRILALASRGEHLWMQISRP